MKVSIIVPVYNVELYLRKCIDSILTQSFQDYELLLIDDGSKDNSLEICKEYESKDSRIQVFSQVNSGPSVARNLGISKARGKYITFIDSDDYVEADYLSELTRHNADMIVSGFKMWYAKNNRTENKCFSQLVLGVKEKNNIAEAIEEGEKKYLLAGPCCKLYKREIVSKHKIYFDENLTYGEDHLFNLKYMNFIQSILLLPYSGYIYTHYGKQSLTNRIVPYNQLYIYNELCYQERKFLYSYFSMSSNYNTVIENEYIYYFWQMLSSMYLAKENRNVRIEFLKRILYKNKNKKYFNSKENLPMSYKMLYMIFKFLPINLADFIVSNFLCICR